MTLVSATDGVANYAVGAARGVFSTYVKPGKVAAYYNAAIKGLMPKEQGRLLHRSAFTVQGFEGVEISYKAVHKATGKMVVKYQRMLLVDTVIYSLAMYPVDENDSTGRSVRQQRAKFFNSISYLPSHPSSK